MTKDGVNPRFKQGELGQAQATVRAPLAEGMPRQRAPTRPLRTDVVDVAFPASGKDVPQDHGYVLYAALVNALPDLHGADWLGVHPIGGRADGKRIALHHRSDVRLRIPPEAVGRVLALAGSRLELAGSLIDLGPPTVHRLTPRSALDARLVLLKLTRPPTKRSDELRREVLDNDALQLRYVEELSRQLKELEASGEVLITGRRSLAIHGKRVVGFSVRLIGLDATSSLRVQAHGLGGRRALGCGIFRPTRARGR